MITQPEITTQIHEPTTITVLIITRGRRTKGEGQPDCRATTETIKRNYHRDSDKRTTTPRHRDPMGRRARLRGRAGVIDFVSPATSTTAGAASC